MGCLPIRLERRLEIESLQESIASHITLALAGCQAKGALPGARFSHEFHKLEMEAIEDNHWYAKSCAATRSALCIRSNKDERLLKVYLGMGTELDHPHVKGCVFMASDYAIVGSLLYQLSQ